MRRLLKLRRIAVIAGVCAVALGVAACGGSSESESTETTSEQTATSEASSATSEESSATSSESAAAQVPFESLETEVPTEYPEPKSGKYRLAYMNPSPGNQFLKTLGTAMKLATEKLGGSFIEVGAHEPNEQVSEMNQLIAQKVNGIAVFALDPKSLQPDVKRAKEAGIRLATIDLNLSETSLSGLGGYETQVWQGRDYGAYLTGKYMAEHLPAGSELGTIEFAIKVPSIVYSIERDTYWAEKFGLKVVGSAENKTDDIAGGEPAMTELLNKHPEIKGVMAYNDPSAIGAYAAARSAGVTGLVLGGENGASEARAAIKNGRETFSIMIRLPSIGKDWAWGLYDLIQGTKVPPTVKAEQAILLDKENVESVPTWEETLKKEYGKS